MDNKAHQWLGLGIVGIVIVAGIALLTANQPLKPTFHPKVQTAVDIMRNQVAKDLKVTAVPGELVAYDRGGTYYYVCGPVHLFRAGDLDETQRVVITVNKELGAGAALFDGRRDPEGMAEFRDKYETNCHI